MPDTRLFLERVIAARGAAWRVFLIAVAIQMLVHLGYLGVERGWLDGLLGSGLYGDASREEARRLMLLYVAALKVLSTTLLMGALFLTLWVRGLRRIA